MKSFAKALLMILLAVTIVFGTAWYLLEYDTDFTHDLLLGGARFFENHNLHGISTWLYDTAYKYGTSIDMISLELADYYKSLGNYAKVEETLIRAINDGGGTEVYIALSKAFVEQDKLKDALALIEGVQDATIRSQLEFLRPASPVPSAPSGYYNEYISLHFQAEGSTVYVSGEPIPSMHKDQHTDPITLGSGETVLYAMAVGENGLVSPATEHAYTVIGVVEPVVFTDAALELAIREAAGIPEGITVYTNDLWEVRSLVIPAEVKSYADMKYLPNLESLSIQEGSDSLAFIGDLENLTSLTIQNADVDTDVLQSIFSRTELTSLTLRNCGVASLYGIEQLTKLTYLDLGENILRNLTPLSTLTGLQTLYLDNNAVVELDALQKLTALQELNLSYNSIVKLKPLASLTGLLQLNLRSNQIKDIKHIGKLTALTNLDLSYNKITSVSNLSTCKSLTELLITNNQLTSLSGLASLDKLESLDFSRNKVTSLPTWNKKCKLYSINGSYNKLTSLKPLSGLTNLFVVTMDYNEKLADVKPLAKCPKLGVLSVYGTKVKDVSAFDSLDITIYYDPT